MSRASRHPENAPFSLEIRRFFHAPAELLFACFTEAEHLVHWFGPREVRCVAAHVDAREGGTYRIEMADPDGSPAIVTGRFLTVETPKRIEMTWAWERLPGAPPEGAGAEETRVAIAFEPAPEGTWLTLHHTLFTRKDARDRHAGGWEGTLDCLVGHLDTLRDRHA